jgi:hypothetical protein
VYRDSIRARPPRPRRGLHECGGRLERYPRVGGRPWVVVCLPLALLERSKVVIWSSRNPDSAARLQVPAFSLQGRVSLSFRLRLFIGQYSVLNGKAVVSFGFLGGHKKDEINKTHNAQPPACRDPPPRRSASPCTRSTSRRWRAGSASLRPSGGSGGAFSSCCGLFRCACARGAMALLVAIRSDRSCPRIVSPSPSSPLHSAPPLLL